MFSRRRSLPEASPKSGKSSYSGGGFSGEGAAPYKAKKRRASSGFMNAGPHVKSQTSVVSAINVGIALALYFVNYLLEICIYRLKQCYSYGRVMHLYLDVI